jgi:hypothetical protein
MVQNVMLLVLMLEQLMVQMGLLYLDLLVMQSVSCTWRYSETVKLILRDTAPVITNGIANLITIVHKVDE